MGDPVLVERHEGILIVTLNRPEARNAVNRDVSVRVCAALDELDADPSPWNTR